MRASVRKSYLGGYTLIETAIVLSVVGVLAASFFSAYKLYMQRKIQNTTELNSTLVTSALSNFLIQKGRFPCPARLDIARDHPDYGIESQCDQTAAATYPYVNTSTGTQDARVVGTTLNGLWYEDSLTQIDSNPDPSITTIVTPRVRRGAVPFRSLALPEDRAYDGYGNRFVFAVTEPQAVTTTYQKGNGGILIRNAQNQPFFNVPTNIFIRPDGTNDINLYTSSSAPPTPLISHTLVDELTGNGTDYVKPTSNNSTSLRVVFSMSDPYGVIDTAGLATLRVRMARFDTGTGNFRNSGTTGATTIRVCEGSANCTANIRHTYSAPSVATPTCAAPFTTCTPWTTYTTTFPVNLVTNWNNVTVRLARTGAGATRSPAIDWVEIELPRVQGTFMDYFLYSAGKDRAGGYSRYGQQVAACPATGLDRENCDTTTQAIYRMADRAEGHGPGTCAGADCHFDDFVKFFTSVEIPLWRVSGTGGDIRDLLNVEATGGKLAVGLPAPDVAPSAPVLQVKGDVRADNANALVSQICDITGGNCFQAADLADTTALATNFTCPAGQYAAGFDSGQIVCTPGHQPCPAGKIATGIRPDGELECTPVVGCPALTVNLCYNSVTSSFDQYALPAGIQGQSITTANSGYNYNETWTCGSTGNPYWSRTGQSGICNCAPVDEIQSTDCNNVLTGNWTGTASRRHQHFCPANNDVYDPWDTSACVCANTTETRDDYGACGAGFSGYIRYQRTWDCATSTWSAWTPVPGGNFCVCNANYETRPRTCPTGWAGTWQQRRDFQCPAGTWTGWYDTTNTCACVDGLPQVEDLGCPAGYSGSKTRTRRWDCATNNWGAWDPVVDTCACTPLHEEADFNECPVAHSGSVHKQRDFVCPSATWTPWSTMSNTCTCTGAQENRTINCTAPMAGTKQQRRDYDCVGMTWGSWYDTVDNCYIQTYNWTPKVAADGPFVTQLPVRAGDTCTTLNASTPCCSQAGGGLGWYHYSECKCE